MLTSVFAVVPQLLGRSWRVALLSGAALIGTSGPPLYMPRTVKRAYANGTRSMDGRPGPNYWENHGRYAITLTALPPNRIIRGTEQITYANNSPDTLRTLVFKLFLNIHKPGAPRDAGESADFLTSGVHVDAFAINGHATPWQDNPNYFTWQPVKLSTPLMPHDSIRLDFTWHYEIARQANREGMLDSTTYYLAYFYPRVAVYDDYNGWDTMNFGGQHEFYSDFNDYDVTVRVPANYIVWGTGTLTNPDSVLQPGALARYESSLTSDEIIHVATPTDLAAKHVTRQTPVNSWHFTAGYVPDVTFAVSDHYDWDASSVVVDDATHRRASVQAAYNDTAADFHHMVRFGRHTLDWLSHNWPGIPYPYEKTTVVQGSADMEYPMMVNDGSASDTTFSKFAAAHEIAHTYFPFYMGINETRYAFMDEGWATTFEYLIDQDDMGAKGADDFYKRFRAVGWAINPSPTEDIPIITPEDVLAATAYGDNAYGKASLGYLAVKDLLGDAEFKKCLQAFMDRWHGKHPLPWDLFNTFNNVSGQDLNWLWQNWYFTNNYIDLAVQSVTRATNGYTVVLANVGGIDAPVNMQLTFGDGSRQVLHETPAIWQANQAQATVTIETPKVLRSLKLDGGIWMDADSTNDVWPARSR